MGSSADYEKSCMRHCRHIREKVEVAVKHIGDFTPQIQQVRRANYDPK